MKTTSIALTGTILAVALSCSARAEQAPSTEAQQQAGGFSLDTSATFTGRTSTKKGSTKLGEVGINSNKVGLGTTMGDFIGGFSYGTLDIGTDKAAKAAAPLAKGYRSLTVEAGWQSQLNQQWSVMAMSSTGWHTAKGTGLTNSKGFGVSLIAGARYALSEKTGLSFGAAYNSLADDWQRFLPYVGLDTKFNDNWELNLGVPRTALTYSINNQWKVAAVLEGEGGVYYTKKDPLPGLAGKPNLDNSRISIGELRAGIQVRYEMGPKGYLSATVGQVLAREFDYHKQNYKMTTKDTAPYVGIAAGLRF
jgi:hypothetical protein